MKKLNEVYFEILKNDKSLKQDEAYESMVEVNSYQMLASMTYSMDPEPFRKSSRSQPTRGEKIMMDAQIKANKTGRSQLVRTRRNEYIVDPAEVSVC